MTPIKATSDHAWWHPVTLNAGSCHNINIGPLSLYIQRQPQQWLLAFERHDNLAGEDRPLSRTVAELPTHLKVERYMFQQSPAAFCLTPVLLERPVVAKTLQPLHIPPGEQTTLYISSPVSVRLALQQPDQLLQEIAISRLSDTWFGPSTQIGELCYADKTHARQSRDELPLRAHRAITPVTVHNHSKQMLSLNKISIPVPYLAVYSAQNGNLWTDPISLQHESADGLARFKTGNLSATDAKGVTLLSAARTVPEKQSLIRAFTGMFTE